MYEQLSVLLGNTSLSPHIKYLDSSAGLANQVIGIMIFLWFQVNFTKGVGKQGYTYQFAYQGMCFPSACSNEEIHQNIVEFR